MSWDLDWLHALLSGTRWVCVKKEPPREWELEVCFRMVPVDGPTSVESIAIVFREDRSMADRDRRRDMRAQFRKCREGLHGVILRMSATGLRRGKPFQNLMPVGFEANPEHPDFERVYELVDPTDERPDSWVLRDRATDLMVEFKIPAGLRGAEIRERLKDAMLRMFDLKKRVARTKAHATVGTGHGMGIVQ